MKKIPLVNRDISWLQFNARVLQEATDPLNPLYERIRFLAIYSSNLAEYFAVRVSQHRNLHHLNKKEKKALDVEPADILDQLLKIVISHQKEVSRIFDEEIIPELKAENIHIRRRKDLNPDQKKEIEQFFHQHMLPYVQPVLLVKGMVRPFLNNAELYLIVSMNEKNKNPATGKKKTQNAIVKIPSDHLDRFIVLSHSKPGHHDIILLDDIVRNSISWLFPGYDIQGTYSIKLTRDAELYIDDEFSGDLIKKIKNSLRNRNIGPASRLVYDRKMPSKLLRHVQNVLGVEKLALIPEGRYHNNFDFHRFPHFGKKHLRLQPLPPLAYLPFSAGTDLFSAIRERDHLNVFPYHSYDSVVRFFESAATDPDVTHIKIIQYRVARESRIMEALMQAARAGKNVTAFIEVKARFDEERNLGWGERLEKAGVKVYYSFPGLKVHSKSALIRRMEKDRAVLYSYLSTGNFNEDTAREYSDFGLFTAHPAICKEVSRLFSILETKQLTHHDFDHLLVGQYNLKSKLIGLIKKEIDHATKGEDAEILIKANSLQDPEMIQWLYQASQAGVSIRLIIRGICCLVPGIKGVSDNIRVISIVDRYLEHGRVFKFHNGGKPRIYISSADWMTRNLNYRIETAVPIYDEEIFKIIDDILHLQWNDNVKARKIDGTGANTYIRRENDIRIQSQIETYYYFKRREEEYHLLLTENENKEHE